MGQESGYKYTGLSALGSLTGYIIKVLIRAGVSSQGSVEGLSPSKFINVVVGRIHVLTGCQPKIQHK